MYDNDYNEEEIRRWEKEGGKFLLENGIVIDTPDPEEVKKFKREIGREEIEKIDSRYESGRFNIIKESERSENIMDDSAYNNDEDLKNLIENFIDEELDDREFEKAEKKMPPKLIEGLKECYKILNEYKADLEEIPELLFAMKYISRILTKYPEPGKYPYPEKVKKSQPMSWQGMQDMLFGGHIPADDEEIEKSSKENPFPSIARAIKIKKQAIDEIEEELEDE